MSSKSIEVIEYETTGVDIGGGDQITNNVHDQKNSSLCWAFAIISALRAAIIKCIRDKQKMHGDHQWAKRELDTDNLVSSSYAG